MTPLTPDQIKSLNPKDRVRIAVEGEVISARYERISICFDGTLSMTNFLLGELTAPTASVTLLEPPVDPDLVLAREVASGRYAMDPLYDLSILKGLHDSDPTVQLALAAIKAANARSKA